MTCPRSLYPATTMFTAPHFCFTTSPTLNFTIETMTPVSFGSLSYIRSFDQTLPYIFRLDRGEGLSMAALGGWRDGGGVRAEPGGVWVYRPEGLDRWAFTLG